MQSIEILIIYSIFKNLLKSTDFINWLDDNFESIKNIGESTSNNIIVKGYKHFIVGYAVYVRFEFTTNNAMGMNMITKATQEICKYILANLEVEDFFLESNMAVDKKASYMNYINGRGKSVRNYPKNN